MEAVSDAWIYPFFISRSDSTAKPFFGPGTLDHEVLGVFGGSYYLQACKFHKYISVYLVVEINKRTCLMLTCTKVFLLVLYGVS